MRGLVWVKNKIEVKGIIGARKFPGVFTWIDSSYVVHDNTRGHTGGDMSIGYGITNVKSLKQKINVKSSTENRTGSDE